MRVVGVFSRLFSLSLRVRLFSVSVSANEVCKHAHRSMVNADDVLAAVEELEFEQFLEPLQTYLTRA